MGACIHVPCGGGSHQVIANEIGTPPVRPALNVEPQTMVAHLPVDISIGIFRIWLSLKDVGRVDSACCSKSWRPWFLSVIHNQSFPIERALLRDSMIAPYIKWVTVRQVFTFCGTLFWSPSTQESSPIYIKSLPFVVDTVLIAGDNLYSTNVGCGALCMMSGSFISSEHIFTAPIKRKLIELMHTACPNIQLFALCTVSNLMISGEDQIEELIQFGVMPALEVIWNHRNSAIARNAITAYSNMTYGTQEHVKAVFEVPRVVRTFLSILKGSSSDRDEKEYMINAVRNMITRSTSEHVHYLLENNVVAILCSLLLGGNLRNIYAALSTLTCLLERTATIPAGAAPMIRTSEIVGQVHKCAGHSAIRELRDHPNRKISAQATTLMRCYF